MALLSVTPITQAGLDQSAAAVSADVAGDSVDKASGLFVQMFNGDSGSHTLTVAKPKTTTACPPFGTLPLSDIVITVPAGEDRSFTIPEGYIDGSGDFSWTYDDVTSVTIAVFSLA